MAKKKKPGLLKKLKTGVVNLITEPVETDADPDDDDAFSEDEALEKRSPVSPLSTAAFEIELQGLIDGHGTVLAGKMQFVDLSGTKKKYPKQWEQMSDPLHALASSVIGRSIDAEDVYTRLGDSHVIVFAKLAQEDAKKRCVAMTAEISELLGEQGVDSSMIAAKSVVGEVDGRAALEELDVEASSIPKVRAKTTKPRSMR